MVAAAPGHCQSVQAVNRHCQAVQLLSVLSVQAMVLREVELPSMHGRPEKVFLVVLGISLFMSLSHLAGALEVDIAKATLHHQLESVGAPAHLCSAATLQEAKLAGMVPKNSRPFRLLPLHYVLKVVDAFPHHWGFLKAPLQLLSAINNAPTTGTDMPAIPMPQQQATLTAKNLLPREVSG